MVMKSKRNGQMLFAGGCVVRITFQSFLDFRFLLLCSFVICFANVGYSPTPRQHFWKIVGSKNFYLPAARILQPLPASPKNFPFCAFLPLSAFPPHFLFPSHASCTFSSNASALYTLFIAKYLINPLRFSSKLLLSKRIFATFQRQSWFLLKY